MKTIAKSLFLAAAFASACVVPAVAAPEIGRPAPEFQLTDLSGKTHRLSDYKGKVVVLEWVNNGCPVVGRHYRSGNMPATQQAALADGAVWLQICSSAPGTQGDLRPEQASAWQREVNASATAYLRDQSGKVGRLYAAKATPHLYVINQDGTLVYKGAIDDQPNAREADTLKANNYVKAALAAIKAGRPVEKAATQAYGCAIKYARDS